MSSHNYLYASKDILNKYNTYGLTSRLIEYNKYPKLEMVQKTYSKHALDRLRYELEKTWRIENNKNKFLFE